MGSRASADAPVPLRVRKVFVGSDFPIGHAVLGCVNHAPTQRESVPVPGIVPKLFGNIFRQCRVDYWLRDAGIHRRAKARDVHCHNEIGWRPVPFSQQAFDKPLVQERHVHLDSRIVRKNVEQRLNKFRLPI